MIQINLLDFPNFCFTQSYIIFYKLSESEKANLEVYSVLLDLLYYDDGSSEFKNQMASLTSKKYFRFVPRSFFFCLSEFPFLKYFQRIPEKGDEYKCLTNKSPVLPTVR